MEAFADWDLLAVVRSCCTTTTTTTTVTASPAEAQPSPPPAVVKKEPCFATNSSSSSASNELLFGFPTTTATTTALFDHSTASFFGPKQQELLDNVCKPRLISPVSSSSSSSLASPVSSASSSVVAGGSFRVGEPPELRRLIRPAQVVFGAPPASSTTQSQRTKKRKNLVKKVFHVPAEGLSNDMWAWRKYGQKPIKGSPYPRGYYRCSSSKGCLARKQVERNRSDPKMFIVTYTGEHSHPMPTHRNSLAGSTRPKPTTGNPPVAVAGESHDHPTSSGSPLTEKSESKTEEDDPIKEDEDDDMGLSDLILNDDFYVGFEKIDSEDLDEGFSGHFSPPMELPWLSSEAGTAAAAGGR